MNHPFRYVLFIVLLLSKEPDAYALPQGFVYLKNIDASIAQDMRYASSNNFTGHRVPGYRAGRCILTRKAAIQLAKVNRMAKQEGYRLKVYDCYRPQQAVNAFYRWSQNNDTHTKPYFYPREPKKTLFDRGYIAKSSGHTRGSTVDLTLIPIHSASHTAEPTQSVCFGTTPAYLNDDSLDTGTRFDCLDKSASVCYKNTTLTQKQNRMVLRTLMLKNGFKPYEKEWWHFTLAAEPYPNQYFNFPVA